MMIRQSGLLFRATLYIYPVRAMLWQLVSSNRHFS